MFQSSLTPKATALLVPAVASLCLLASISLVTAQEGREKSGQRGQGGERGEAGRQPSQRPAGDQGAGTRSEAERQPSQAAEVNRGEGARGGQTTVHNHYYYGAGAYPAGGGAYYGGGSGAQGADLSGFTNPATARSQGALTMTQAANQSIENHNYAVSSYYNNQKIHDQFMADEEAKDKGDVARTEYFDRNIEPGRLTSAQLDRATGVINWPPLLRDKQFSDSRRKLDQLYHARTPANSGVDSDNYVNITQACDAMKDVLKGMIKDVPPETYIAASHFIKSLSYEGQFAAK